LTRLGPPSQRGWSGLVALGVLLFAAAGFVGSLQDALDKIWEAPPRPGGVWSFIRSKLLSFSLVLAAAFLLLVSLVLSTIMTALAGGLTAALGLPEGIVSAVIVVANFLLSVLIFAAIFKYMPSVFVTWRAAAAGSLFTAVLFALGRFALAWYLGREAEASAYGAATSLVLLLIWVYYSAQILFVGAQFSQTFQNEGHRPATAAAATATQPIGSVPVERFFSNVVAAFGFGLLLGAAVMQRPRSHRLPGEPSLLQKAAQLLDL
jgi:membrane protein